jgi:tetratricopeptide (TPR) repeat protein
MVLSAHRRAPLCAAALAVWLVCGGRVGRHAFGGSNAHAQAADAKQARACFESGQAAYLAGRLDDARRDFECAYSQLPSAELAWNLARVSERMGDVERGVRYFREYLTRAQVSPRERRAVEARVQKLLDLQARQSASLKTRAETASAMGADARTFFQRGVKLYRGGHYQAAAAAFTAALQMSQAGELHYNLAMTSERLGNVEEACDHYRAYLGAVPEAPDRTQIEAHIVQLQSRSP